ncbi:hypothetical protein GRJ90_004979 [Salmonella enterica]|nr:hypothetical protein [Salmonella enterica]
MCLFKVILLVGIELFLLQILGFPRKNSYQEENILENSDNLGSGTLQGCKAARLQGCKAARLQGCKAARLQGCKAARLNF